MSIQYLNIQVYTEYILIPFSLNICNVNKIHSTFEYKNYILTMP